MARLLIVLAALAVVGVWAFGQVTTQPQSAATPLPPPAATAAIATQLSALQRALAQAQQTGRAVPVTLTFTDADLTAAAASAPLSSGGISVSDPAVQVGSGSLTLIATARLGPLSGLLRVLASPAVADGRANVRVESATIAGVALPDAARATLQATLQQALLSLMPPRLQLTSIVAAPGVITVQALALP